MKTIFFVTGPEGCGTYMLAEAFVNAGCTYCDKETTDEVRNFVKEMEAESFVLRRSIPHRGQVPLIAYLARALEEDGHTVHLLAIVRDQHSTIQSVLNRTEMEYERLAGNYGMALEQIARFVMWANCRVISYEGFVTASAYRKTLFDRYGLPEPDMEFYDGNKKYYS